MRYSFTQDDLQQPVFCIKCHRQIPKLESDAGKGLCVQCVAGAAPVAPPPVTTTVPVAQDVFTQHSSGVCVNCRGTATYDISPNQGVQVIGAFGWICFIIALVMLISTFGCIFSFPLFIVGAICVAVGRPEYVRICRQCGHQQKIAVPVLNANWRARESFWQTFKGWSFQKRFFIVMALALSLIALMSYYLYSLKQ